MQSICIKSRCEGAYYRWGPTSTQLETMNQKTMSIYHESPDFLNTLFIDIHIHIKTKREERRERELIWGLRLQGDFPIPPFIHTLTSPPSTYIHPHHSHSPRHTSPNPPTLRRIPARRTLEIVGPVKAPISSVHVFYLVMHIQLRLRHVDGVGTGK